MEWAKYSNRNSNSQSISLDWRRGKTTWVNSTKGQVMLKMKYEILSLSDLYLAKSPGLGRGKFLPLALLTAITGLVFPANISSTLITEYEMCANPAWCWDMTHCRTATACRGLAPCHQLWCNGLTLTQCGQTQMSRRTRSVSPVSHPLTD